MRDDRLRALLGGAAAVALVAMLAAPVQGQTSLSLYGDVDCFGTGLMGTDCPEGGTTSSSTWLPGWWGSVTATASDPVWTDVVRNGGTPTWTHSFAATAASAFLRIRTAGIADIAGPYDVFVDGVSVGQMPRDGFGHVIVETFTFALPAALIADGLASVSLTPSGGDSWAIDYSEVFTKGSVSVPEPGTMLLLGTGLLGLAAVRRRREDEVA